MSKETIEIPIGLYKGLIDEHLKHQAPNSTRLERDELIEIYIQLAKEKYWEKDYV